MYINQMIQYRARTKQHKTPLQKHRYEQNQAHMPPKDAGLGEVACNSEDRMMGMGRGSICTTEPLGGSQALRITT